MAEHSIERHETCLLLDEAEKRQLLDEWNKSNVLTSPDKVHNLFQIQPRKRRNPVAIELEDERLTYRELNSRANRLTRYCRELGVGPEVSVGICMEPFARYDCQPAWYLEGWRCVPTA